MHYDNGSEIIIAVVFYMNPQLGGLGPKAQDLVIPFRLGEGEPLPDFHLIALVIISELLFRIYQTGQINNITRKYITELSNMKLLQHYMNSLDLDFRRFERQPQSNQLSIIFTPSTELIFETIGTEDIANNLSD